MQSWKFVNSINLDYNPEIYVYHYNAAQGVILRRNRPSCIVSASDFEYNSALIISKHGRIFLTQPNKRNNVFTMSRTYTPQLAIQRLVRTLMFDGQPAMLMLQLYNSHHREPSSFRPGLIRNNVRPAPLNNNRGYRHIPEPILGAR